MFQIGKTIASNTEDIGKSITATTDRLSADIQANNSKIQQDVSALGRTIGETHAKNVESFNIGSIRFMSWDNIIYVLFQIVLIIKFIFCFSL